MKGEEITMITLCTVRTEKRKYVITTTDAKHKYKEYNPHKEYPDPLYSERLRGYYAGQQQSTQQEEMMAHAQSSGLYGSLDFHGNILANPRPGQPY